MQTIIFNKDGGPIVAAVSSGFAQPGSYFLMLREANQATVVWEQDGDFTNDDDDAHSLPTPNEANDGRQLEAIYAISILPSIKQYNAVLKVEQDGRELGTESQTDETTKTTVFIRLAVVLKQADTPQPEATGEPGATDEPAVADQPAPTDQPAQGGGTT